MERTRYAVAAIIFAGAGLAIWNGSRGDDDAVDVPAATRSSALPAMAVGAPFGASAPAMRAESADLADAARDAAARVRRATTMAVGAFRDDPPRAPLAQRALALEPQPRVGPFVTAPDPRREPSRAGTKRPDAVRRAAYRPPEPDAAPLMTEGRRIPSRMRLPGRLDDELGMLGGVVDARAIVCVDADGRPRDVQLHDGTGSVALDDALRDRLLRERYRPLRRGDRAVAFCERVTIVLEPAAAEGRI